MIGARPIVFDREFSYRELLNCLVEEGVHFVIRLNMGAHAPNFYYDAEQKQRLRLLVAPINKPQIYRQVYYLLSVPEVDQRSRWFCFPALSCCSNSATVWIEVP